jgi:hypothetical protein
MNRGRTLTYFDTVPFPASEAEENRHDTLCDYCFVGGPHGTNFTPQSQRMIQDIIIYKRLDWAGLVLPSTATSFLRWPLSLAKSCATGTTIDAL